MERRHVCEGVGGKEEEKRREEKKRVEGRLSLRAGRAKEKVDASTRDRTRDLQIFSLTLSQLSYRSVEGYAHPNPPAAYTQQNTLKPYTTHTDTHKHAKTNKLHNKLHTTRNTPRYTPRKTTNIIHTYKRTNYKRTNDRKIRSTTTTKRQNNQTTSRTTKKPQEATKSHDSNEKTNR